MPIAVCGAHMQGLPLNHQLLERGGRLLKHAKTAARYRLFALPGEPVRPGLIRDSHGGGSIEIEVWALRAADLGSFLEDIPAPLGLGKIELESGETVTGFVCESHATHSAREITALGGWRAYLAGSLGRS
jgi:allophanate hydrolase